MGKNGQTEFLGPARSTSGNDVAVDYDTLLHILCTLGRKRLLKAVIACHLPAIKTREKTQDHTWSSADRSYSTAFCIMLLHDVHKLREGCKVCGARHSAREDHHISRKARTE